MILNYPNLYLGKLISHNRNRFNNHLTNPLPGKSQKGFLLWSLGIALFFSGSNFPFAGCTTGWVVRPFVWKLNLCHLPFTQ